MTMSELLTLIEKLNENDIKNLTKLEEIQKATSVIPFEAETSEESLDGAEVIRYYLHVQIKKTCYLVYGKYEYKAFTSTDKKGKKRIKVDKIKLEMNSGHGSFTKSKSNTSRVKKIDEVYGKGDVCKRGKLLATATIHGVSWKAQTSV